MKQLQVTNIILSVAMLAMIFLLYKEKNSEKGIIPIKDIVTTQSFWDSIAITPEISAKIRSEEIDYTTAKAIVGKLRDTLNNRLGPTYSGLHTGGIKFKLTEIKAYIDDIIRKAQAEPTPIDPATLNLYICPGVYPAGTQAPHGGASIEKHMTAILIIPKNGNPIFDTQTRKLTLQSQDMLGAFNWGDLEPH
jgi:hypothetical protein